MSELYHNRVLELAAGIAHAGRLEEPEGEAERVSRICGSRVHVSVCLDETGERVSRIAVDPRACALGQAATSVLSANAIGCPVLEIGQALEAFRAMLTQDGPPPEGRFWELRHLAPVADYPPRHASVLLAFEAVMAAIDQARARRSGAP
jgi:NifU-like protein involved in Fe-S cluster formation